MLRISIKLRSLARRRGLIRPLRKLLRALGIGSTSYEQRFQNEMQRLVRPGDVVWDVGANVGFYTNLFSKWVQDGGLVFAFEPATVSFGRLRSETKDRNNVCCLNYALGSYDGICEMLWDECDETSPNNRVVLGAGAPAATRQKTVSIPICRGDYLESTITRPSVVKIDVEGAELEVIKGMCGTLSRPECRVVFCEVHFSLLEQNGSPLAPIEIEKLLRQDGFDHLAWVDASHLVAEKRRAAV